MAAQKNEAGLYEVEVDTKLYEFQKWGAEKSLDTLLDIMQFAGKPLSLLAAAMLGKEGVKAEVTPDMIGTIMDSLLGGMGTAKKSIMAIIKRVTTENVTCDHQPIRFNEHFADALDHLFKVVKAGLDVQYGSFFYAVLKAGGVKAKDLPSLKG